MSPFKAASPAPSAPAWRRIRLEPEAVAEARRVGAELAREFDLERESAPYGAHLWDGKTGAGPVLHLDDFSALPFLDGISGVEHYQHRARLRAVDGDLFAAVVPPAEGYEEYCRDRLGLGEPECLVARPRAGSLAIAAACGGGRAFARLTERARRAGRLDLHPFMGIEAVWQLASRLAEASAAPVRVIAPAPPVTWLANDKAGLTRVVREVLGEEWLVETVSTRHPEGMATALCELAGRHRSVALKRLRCVSGMGNATFEARDLARHGLERARREVDGFLAFTEWDGQEEVQVVAWEETEWSPSTQLWLPPAELGPPRLDGIYEQILEGPQRVFAGSRPSRLPEAVHRVLAEGALRVAVGLQAMGYVGRCYFDHLLVGDPHGAFHLRFVECNGRWGGSSLPMHLVDRLLPGPRPPYRAQDFVHPDLQGVSFLEILQATGEEAFDPSSGRGRFLFYNVGPLAEYGKLDVISLGRSQEEAEEGMKEILPRRLGLGLTA